jgi:DNA-binding transcriptional LysR family regulator
VLDQVHRAEAVGKRAGRGELGHIEIGYVASAAFSGLAPSAILEFRRFHKDVSIRLSEMERRSNWMRSLRAVWTSVLSVRAAPIRRA